MYFEMARGMRRKNCAVTQWSCVMFLGRGGKHTRRMTANFAEHPIPHPILTSGLKQKLLFAAQRDVPACENVENFRISASSK